MRKLNITDKIAQSGRSMVEMLGVLAIMGILTIFVVSEVRYALDKNEANQIMEEVAQQAVIASASIASGSKVDVGQFAGPFWDRYHEVYNDTEYPGFFSLTLSGLSDGVVKHLRRSAWGIPYNIYVDVGGKFIHIDAYDDSSAPLVVAFVTDTVFVKTAMADGGYTLKFVFENQLNPAVRPDYVNEGDCTGTGGTWNGRSCKCPNGTIMTASGCVVSCGGSVACPTDDDACPDGQSFMGWQGPGATNPICVNACGGTTGVACPSDNDAVCYSDSDCRNCSDTCQNGKCAPNLSDKCYAPFCENGDLKECAYPNYRPSCVSNTSLVEDCQDSHNIGWICSTGGSGAQCVQGASCTVNGFTYDSGASIGTCGTCVNGKVVDGSGHEVNTDSCACTASDGSTGTPYKSSATTTACCPAGQRVIDNYNSTGRGYCCAVGATPWVTAAGYNRCCAGNVYTNTSGNPACCTGNVYTSDSAGHHACCAKTREVVNNYNGWGYQYCCGTGKHATYDVNGVGTCQ